MQERHLCSLQHLMVIHFLLILFSWVELMRHSDQRRQERQFFISLVQMDLSHLFRLFWVRICHPMQELWMEEHLFISLLRMVIHICSIYLRMLVQR